MRIGLRAGVWSPERLGASRLGALSLSNMNANPKDLERRVRTAIEVALEDLRLGDLSSILAFVEDLPSPPADQSTLARE